MNYITTNIRIPEEDYLRLKIEAARQRKSLAGVIREKIGEGKIKKTSPEALMARIRRHAHENAKYLKGFDSLKALREIRDEN
ncbi:MAG: Uncharacterized protein G01um10147_347 [Microgenomates group bacterium Gr01-1014_7]|nr:MAG: Uncharacterized protein G01um10147_347 [Microgenomates group bacterium Gr01-1014_7]